MTAAIIKAACQSYARAAEPCLVIKDEVHYEETLALIEVLMDEVGESADHPLNALIVLFSHVVEAYENQDPELAVQPERSHKP